MERFSWLLDLMEAWEVKKVQSPPLWWPFLLIHCRKTGSALVSSTGSCSSGLHCLMLTLLEGSAYCFWELVQLQNALFPPSGRGGKWGRGSTLLPALPVLPAPPPKALKVLQGTLMAFQGVQGFHAQKGSRLSLMLCY